MALDTTVQTEIYFDAGRTTMNVGTSGNVKLFDTATLTFGTGDDVTINWDGTGLVIAGLPTSDPGVTGAVYADSNILTLSAGS